MNPRTFEFLIGLLILVIGIVIGWLFNGNVLMALSGAVSIIGFLAMCSAAVGRDR